MDLKYFDKQKFFIEGCIDVISGFYRFIPDGDSYYSEMKSLFNSNALVLSDYFHYLYVKNDLQFCINSYSDFLAEQQNSDNKMKILLQKFTRKLLVHNILPK